ncbi:UDP-N-acetylglucosamine 2-epimerase (hydrolyzing) [bacterium E08(2017)]|nr:UDP-N-acetylglucosamine 2-epimerase (hydrolyzing) [bacterium E08(2017)]
MKKRKICVVITSRGNYAKMRSFIDEASKSDEIELAIIVGGGAVLPKYGDIVSELHHLKKKVNRVVHFLVEGETPQTMAKSAGLAVLDFANAFENLQPDIVIVIADRFECLPIAIAATYMNIPIAHVEGGEVTGSIDESVRHAITKMSHYHFPATRDAAKRIERLGENPEYIFEIGCTSLDVIAGMDLEDMTPIVEYQETGHGVGAKLDPNDPYLVVIQHPVTTEYSENLKHVNETINAIDSLGINTFWIWPNMDAGSDGISKGIRVYRENRKPEHLHFFRSCPIECYAPLLYNAKCIVGNSSSGIREAAFMGVPCVNIGTRQNGRDRGANVVDVGYDQAEISKAVEDQLGAGRYEPDYLYGKGDAGRAMAEVLAGVNLYCQKRITY